MTDLVTCRACQKMVSEEAKACPACGQPIYKWYQQVESKNDGLVKLGFGLVGGLFMLLIFSSSPEEEAADNSRAAKRVAEKAEEDKCGSELEALTFSQLFVKQQLKAPARSEFGYLSDSQLQMTSCGTWSVKSHVDAENSFGAMLRKPYHARLEKEGINWKLLELRLE